MRRVQCTSLIVRAKRGPLIDVSGAGAVVPPVEWPEQWTQPPRVSRAVFGRVVGAVFVAVLAAVVLWRLLSGRPEALVGDAIVAGFALLAFGVAQPRRPRGEPEFVNAVVLTRAAQQPPDSWVHLVRDRGASAVLITGIFVLGGAFAAAGVRGLVDVVAEGLTEIMPVVGLSIALLAGAGLIVVAIVLWRGRARNASFGRAPAGLALGPEGIVAAGPGAEGFVPWARFRSIRAERRESGRSGASRWIVLTDDAGTETSVSADAVIVHPWALWAMLHSGVHNPDWRARLGTGSAHDELRAWSRGALSADPAPGW